MCPKCAINKAGKRSCCARGGTWFKNCGDTGDTTVDYTWAEGIQACRSALQAVVSSLKAPLEEVHPLDNNKPRNNTQQQTDNYRSIGISNAENSNLEGRVEVAQVWVCICVLSIIERLYVYFIFLSGHGN